MDTETELQLQEQLAEMAELLRQQNSAMAAQVKTMNELAAASGVQTTATKKQTQAEQNATNAVTGNTAKRVAADKAMAIQQEANERFRTALREGSTALLGFSKAMLDVSPGMAKYAESIKGAVDAAGNFASGFGLLGTIASTLLGAFSGLVTAALKYSDAVVKGYDDVSKLGGAIGSSAEGILKLGHQAGLSSQNLEVFTKNAASLGVNIKALGNTTSDGVNAFGKIINVGDRTLQQYRKLGYSQDELIAVQAKYVDLQAKAGADLTRSPKEIQKASLKYLDRLNVLAQITGISVEKQQAMLDQAMAQENFNAYMTGLNADIAKAKAEGNMAEAERLEKVRAAKEEYATMAQQFGPAKATAILEAMSTNGEMVVTKSTAGLAMSMPEVAEQIRNLNRGINQTPDLIVASNKSYENFRNQIGNAGVGMGATSRELQQIMMQDNQTRQMYGRTSNTTAEEMRKQIEDAKAQQEAKKNEASGAMAQRAAIESQERAARIAFDQILAVVSNKLMNLALKLMPKVNDALSFLANNLDTVGKVLKGIGIAFAVLAGAAVIGKVVSTLRSFGEALGNLFGRKTGELGSSEGNAMHVRLAGTSSKGGMLSSAKGMLGKMTGAGKSTTGIGTSDSDKAMGHLTGVAGQPGGSKVGTFLEGLSKGLETIGKASIPVLQGTAVISIAIVAIGAAVGLAGVILGKTLPSLAEGLTSFDKINGENLALVGKGMVGLGTGILAMGGEGIAKGFGAIVEWFTGTEDEDPIANLGEQLKKFQSIRVDKDRVKYNAEAFTYFSEAFSKAAISGAPGTVAAGIADGVSNFFSKEPPFERFEYFSNKITVNPAKVKQNATAFKVFSEAMSSYKGSGPLGALGAISTALADAVDKHFKVDPPIDKFVYFATRPINATQAKTNAKAFVDFANALMMYKPAPGALEALSQWIGSKIMGGLFEEGGPIDNFKKFSEMDFGTKASTNADNFKKYAESMGALGAPGTGTVTAPNSSVSGSKLSDTGNTISDVVSNVGESLTSTGVQIGNWLGFGDRQPTTNVKPKNVTMGPMATLNNVDSDLVKRFYSAAKDYGKPVTISSGWRPDSYQAQLWVRGNILHEPGIYKPAMPKDTQTITYKGKQYKVPGSNRGSPHLAGRALDVTPSTGYGNLDPYLQRYGLHRPVRGDPPHVQKARDGGIFGAAEVASPGKKLAPLNLESALMKLAKKPIGSAPVTSSSSIKDKDSEAIYMRNVNLNNEIIRKLDQVIDVLESDHATQSKILRHSAS